MPPDQITGLRILLIATLLAERRATRADLDELIGGAEPLVRQITRNVVHSVRPGR